MRVSLIGAILFAAACNFTGPQPGPFYALPESSIPASPGTLIRFEEMGGAPVGAQAWRVLYSSTGLDGRPVAVSGMVIIPPGPAPSRGWDVVAWAHPTTGVARQCAPSLRPDAVKEIPGAAELLSRGYVVTATDYPGLGTAGAHPYLVGVSEGRAVLDLVRAARHIPAQNIGPRFAAWGHSQGGQAALFAGELAAGYAPELALVGVGAAAPATNLSVLTDDDLNSISGRVLLSFVIWSWVRVYGADQATLIKPAGGPVVDSVAAGCLQSEGEFYRAAFTAAPLRKDFLTMHPDSLGQWRSLLRKNEPGAVATGAPFFIAQGAADSIVRPSLTRAFATKLCAQGERVRYLPMAGVQHIGAAVSAAPAMVAWLEDRFAGNPAPDDCGKGLRNN